MTMIHCNHCNREISEMATVCPHCGAKTERGIKNTVDILKMIGIIVDVIAVILIVWAAFEFIGDISKYNDNNWWNGGYNYKSPLTDHEKGVLWRFGIGAFFAIISSALITSAKNAENSASVSSRKTSAFSSYAYSQEANRPESGWKCVCGQSNANYIGTCSCGRSRKDVEKVAAQQASSTEQASAADVQEDAVLNQLNGIEAIKAYKELLDSGVISQEDFDKKKNELLGI